MVKNDLIIHGLYRFFKTFYITQLIVLFYKTLYLSCVIKYMMRILFQKVYDENKFNSN